MAKATLRLDAYRIDLRKARISIAIAMASMQGWSVARALSSGTIRGGGKLAPDVEGSFVIPLWGTGGDFLCNATVKVLPSRERGRRSHRVFLWFPSSRNRWIPLGRVMQHRSRWDFMGRVENGRKFGETPDHPKRIGRTR